MLNMEELPALIEAGLAAMLTVGITGGVELLNEAPPHPLNTSKSGHRNSNANGDEIQRRDGWAHGFIAVFPSNFLRGASNTRSIVRLNFDRKEQKTSAGAALSRSGSRVCAWLGPVFLWESTEGGRRTQFLTIFTLIDWVRPRVFHPGISQPWAFPQYPFPVLRMCVTPSWTR